MKRHSLASIADAWNGYATSGRRGSTLSTFRISGGNAIDCAARHESLESIQIAVIQIFQKKKMQEGELHTLQEHARQLVKTEAGPLIYDYFKDKLLTKGMVILREFMKNDLGTVLLKKMSEQWNYFYLEILPMLQAMLYPLLLKETENTTRQVILLSFRDIVVLKVGIEETLSSLPDDDVTPEIKQMLLVLQSVNDGHPPTECHRRIEKMLARVVNPLLGFFGYYEGSSIPVNQIPLKPSYEQAGKSEKNDTFDPIKHRQLISPRVSHRNLTGHLTGNQMLTPVVEHETSRRHSIDVYDKVKNR